MKKTYLIASFLAVGAGAISASALDIKGSDTLFTISTDVITAKVFPSGPISWTAISGLNYIGGGSGTGETAALNGTQQVAPMSRFLGSVCTGTAASPTTSEGLVIALDGVSVVMNHNTAASDSCNGLQTDASKQPTLGLVSNKTITWAAGTNKTFSSADHAYAAGSYTFSDWTDVLRILFAGMDHNAGNTAANQNCNSDVRNALIANWGLLFENQGCSSGTCTSLKHGFRRDDYSGTTDTIQAILNLPSIPGTKLTDPFCNSIPATGAFPAGLPLVMQYRPLAAFQDFDPIRVPCTASDSVCDQDGTTGWLMVIEPSTDVTAAAAFPTSTGTSNMGFAVTGQLNDNTTYYCPNGDTPQFINSCLMPLDSSNSFANNAQPGSKPIFSFGGAKFSSAIDGRVYNLLLHNSAGALIKASNGIPFVTSYYRNYRTQCQLLDATQQIGCFVGTAEPCSIGYSGLGAVQQANADAMRLDGILPTAGNVQSFAYPLSRKLYLNTLKGFENVADTNGELTFAKAEANKAEIDYYVNNEGFVALPDSVTLGGSAGAPYCEDFNEQARCAAASNVNACANNPSGIPTGGTICGNAALESYERCDSGTANGSSTSNCSATCTCKVGGVDAAGRCCIKGTGTSAIDCCANPTLCTPGDGT